MEGPLNQEIKPRFNGVGWRGHFLFGQAGQTQNLHDCVRNKRAFSSARVATF